MSILKSGESPEAQAELDEKRRRLRALVRKNLAEEAMLAEPDEGRAPASRGALSDQVRLPRLLMRARRQIHACWAICCYKRKNWPQYLDKAADACILL